MDSTRRSHTEGPGSTERSRGRRLRYCLTFASLLVAGCGKITENDDGIAWINLQVPANTFLEIGRPLQLAATAYDRDGNPVDIALTWFTPDTTLLVDPVDGIVTNRTATGLGRVQVGVFGKDTLVSSPTGLILTITGPADTIYSLTGDSLEVTSDDDILTLTARVEGGAPRVGTASRPVRFRIIEPADSTLVFGSGRIQDSVMTGTTGDAFTSIRAASGATPPDRAVVELRAYHPSGDPIPGSGSQIVIRYLHQ